jgi:hypothetical protein
MPAQLEAHPSAGEYATPDSCSRTASAAGIPTSQLGCCSSIAALLSSLRRLQAQTHAVTVEDSSDDGAGSSGSESEGSGNLGEESSDVEDDGDDGGHKRPKAGAHSRAAAGTKGPNNRSRATR